MSSSITALKNKFFLRKDYVFGTTKIVKLGGFRFDTRLKLFYLADSDEEDAIFDAQPGTNVPIGKEGQ